MSLILNLNLDMLDGMQISLFQITHKYFFKFPDNIEGILIEELDKKWHCMAKGFIWLN